MAMGNTTVYPKNKNTAYVCGSVVRIEDEKLKEGNNGPLYVAQGDILEIPVSDSLGFKINESGEIIRPDGSKTDSKMPKKEVQRYESYIENIHKQKEPKGNDR